MIDILIPVLARPDRAEPLVHNIKETTKSKHHILFLCSSGDEAEIEACIATGEDVMVMTFEAGPADFAKKINAGYRHTEGDFIQVGADDLLFHAGWDTAALEAANTTAGVIGTNDLHNPRVRKEQMSTHPFIRRNYIEAWNGTFDHTGEIFCELYDHQWVDDELVQTAMMRHRWIFAKDAVVEHLHPYFGTREMDATYEKGLKHGTEDFALFQKRRREMRKQIPKQRLQTLREAR